VWFGVDGHVRSSSIRGQMHVDSSRDTAERRANACIMFIIDILSGRVNSSNLLSLISISAPWYDIRTSDFLRVDFHCTNYGILEPLNGAVRRLNEFAGLFDLHLSTSQFFKCLRSVF
jgi:hypothetical protein